LFELLELQEVALEHHLNPLKLLLGSITLNGNELSLHGGYLRALGFGACETKSDEHDLLFIGLLVLARRGYKVLPLLSINRTQTQLLSEYFWKGEDPRVRYDTTSGKNNPDRVNPAGLISIAGSPHRVRRGLCPLVTVSLYWAISWAM
jgi:hypothetical protein